MKKIFLILLMFSLFDVVFAQIDAVDSFGNLIKCNGEGNTLCLYYPGGIYDINTGAPFSISSLGDLMYWQ